MPNPLDDARAYSFAIIAGVRTPGIAEVKGASAAGNWDKAKGYGLTGATQKFTGDDLSDFTITISLYDTDDHDEYNDTFAPFLAQIREKAKAVDFYHPRVSETPINIRSVVVKEIGQLTRADETGLETVDIKLSQFRKPKPQLAKPKGSETKTQQSAPDEADQIIAQLTAQLSGLAK